MYARIFEAIVNSSLRQEIHNMLLESYHIRSDLRDRLNWFYASQDSKTLIAEAYKIISDLNNNGSIRYTCSQILDGLVQSEVYNKTQTNKQANISHYVSYYPKHNQYPKVIGHTTNSDNSEIFIYSTKIPTNRVCKLSKQDKTISIMSPELLPTDVVNISIWSVGNSVFISYTFHGDDPAIPVMKYETVTAIGICSNSLKQIIRTMIGDAVSHSRIVTSQVGRNASKNTWLDISDKVRKVNYRYHIDHPSAYMDEFLWTNRHNPLPAVRIRLPKLKSKEQWSVKLGDHGEYVSFEFKFPLANRLLKQITYAEDTKVIFGINNQSLGDMREPEYVDITILESDEVMFTFYSLNISEIVFDKQRRWRA